MIIKCQRCEVAIEVNEPVSKHFKYTCKKHNIEPEDSKLGLSNDQFDPRFESGFYKTPPGFQIIIPREEEIVIPEWATSTQISKIIARTFPKMRRDDVDEFRSSRWAAVAYLYWRMRFSETEISEELFFPVEEVHNIVNRIKRAALGLRSDNTEARKRNKPAFKLG